VSLLFSVIIIYLLGYTFNFMVMFGMLLGLGMLIDGAIVVTEYADRKMSEGLDHREAYSEAVKRMFWPVTASTATTLAAFLPLIFWPGISGQFMRYLPVTVFTVLSGSLLYALLFGPVLGSIFGRPTAHSAASRPRWRSSITATHPPRRRHGLVCAPAAARLSPPAAHRRPDLLSALISVFWAYGQFGRGMVFFNDADPQFVTVSVNARGNFSAVEIDRLVREVEQQVLQVAGIRSVNTQTTTPGGGDLGRGGSAPPTIASAPCSSNSCRRTTATAMALR
jgi:multidrug efflux pump